MRLRISAQGPNNLSNRALSNLTHFNGPLATTVAARGRSNSKAISPKYWDGPKRPTSVWGSSSDRLWKTTAVPDSIIKKSSPGWPCSTITSPSLNEMGWSASAIVNLSHLSRLSEKNFFKVKKNKKIKKEYFKHNNKTYQIKRLCLKTLHTIFVSL